MSNATFTSSSWIQPCPLFPLPFPSYTQSTRTPTTSCDPELGAFWVKGRDQNIQRQKERIQDPAYRQEAGRVLDELKRVRDEGLAAADQKHNITTRLLTESYLDDFIAPVSISLGYPPENTDMSKSFNDISIPTLYAASRLGMLEARRRGLVGFIDVHNDDKHSASKKDQSFPHGKPVDWDEPGRGGSQDHHAVMFKFWYDYHLWRFHHVFGESVFCGISNVKQAYDEMMKTVNIPYCNIPRAWLPYGAYAHLVDIVSTRDSTVYFSPTLVPGAPPLPVQPDLTNRLTALKHFSYSSSITARISLPYYAQTRRDMPALEQIQQIERTLDEIRILVDADVDPKSRVFLSRVYIARCKRARGFFIPPTVRWAMTACKEEEGAFEWTEEDVEGRIGARARAKLQGWAERWVTNGQPIYPQSGSIGGFLDGAISGWKLALQQSVDAERYPSVSNPTAAILCPAVGHSGEVALLDRREKARSSVDAERYPSVSNSTAAILCPAVGHGGEIALIRLGDKACLSADAERYPSVSDPNAAILCPAVGHGGEIALLDRLEKGRSSVATERYPSIADSFAAILCPAVGHSGEIALIYLGQKGVKRAVATVELFQDSSPEGRKKQEAVPVADLKAFARQNEISLSREERQHKALIIKRIAGWAVAQL
ncbi:hypothetical protein JCM11641_002895 [Rhodosporidiobolus odoratus]